MEDNLKHIDTAVISRSPRFAFGAMYSMHKYWSKKSPDIIAEHIKDCTQEGDIVLDPFCGSGIVAGEAIRLKRRVIIIDLNPMATFIAKTTLTPVNLYRLEWAFRDIKSACEKDILKLYVTICNKCHKEAVVEFIVWVGDSLKRIAYRCTCSKERLFKFPDRKDESVTRSFDKEKIPFWYPRDVQLPIIQKERFQYLHELFTRRNLIALSMILNSIERIPDSRVREVMKLTFTAALDKCSKLKPQQKGKEKQPSLYQGWVAPRFYAPPKWQEVNPWDAFERAFEKIYKGKKESNEKLSQVAIGSSFKDLKRGNANVIIFEGSAETVMDRELPVKSVNYVITDPPYGEYIQYLSLSTFWGAWLKFNFNYDKELVVNKHRGKTFEEYLGLFSLILKSIRRVVRSKSHVHIFFQDARGPYLKELLKLMIRSRIAPEKILYQPPPSSFGTRVKNKKGHYGTYLIRGRAINKKSSPSIPLRENLLQEKVINALERIYSIRGEKKNELTLDRISHSLYQGLDKNEILSLANLKQPVEVFIKDAIAKLAHVSSSGLVTPVVALPQDNVGEEIQEKCRKALLDAKALYTNNRVKENSQKNQIYQRVLYKLQSHGVTVDDIREIEKEIKPREIALHRKQRLINLLYDVGKTLDYKCQKENIPNSEVVWEVENNIRIQFLVLDKEIQVKAVRNSRETGEPIEAKVGSIFDEELEKALYKWAKKNRAKAGGFLEKINRMDDFVPLVKRPDLLRLKVKENREQCPEHYLITLEVKGKLDYEPHPGQFFHIICDSSKNEILADKKEKIGYSLTLRRPFSVHRIKYAEFDRRILAAQAIIPYEIKEIIKRPISEIDILYKVVGKGTEVLSKIKKGESLDVIGPTGNGFLIEEVDSAVIVAGGIGVAPLVGLAERLRYLGSKIYVYLGALKKESYWPILSRLDSTVERGYLNGAQAFLGLIKKEFEDIGAEQVTVCTDDGSVGKKGVVTEFLKGDIESNRLPLKKLTIYACGPSKMIEAVSGLAKHYEINCQVLLEQRMACGIGACLSCTCNVLNRTGGFEKKRVCIDGPVFKSEEIKWET